MFVCGCVHNELGVIMRLGGGDMLYSGIGRVGEENHLYQLKETGAWSGQTLSVFGCEG